MAALNDSLSDTRTYPAWAGSPADLLPVLEAIQRQYRDLRSDAMAGAMRHALTMRDLKAQGLTRAEAFFERRDVPGDPLRSEYAEDVRRAREDLQAEDVKVAAAREAAERVDDITISIVTRKGAERGTSGRPDEIVEYLAHKPIRKMTLSAPTGSLPGHRLSLFFERGTGVRVSVTSRDSRWAMSALGEIEEALEVKVPAWARLRSLWFLMPFFYGAAIVIVLSLTGVALDTKDTPTLYVLSGIRGVLIGCLGLGAVWATRYFVPAFEMLPPGGKARVDRIVIAIGGGLGAVVLSLLERLIP
jgi:hypothetical protein